MVLRVPRLALALALIACGSDHDAPTPTSGTTVAPIAAPPRSAPPTSIVGLDDPPPVSDEVVARGPLLAGDAPEHGCVLASDAPQPVLEGASTSDIAVAFGTFVVAAYVAGSPEVVALARIAPGGVPSPLGRIELGGSLDTSHRTAPPVIERLGEAYLGVGLIDPAGGVRLARFEAGARAPNISVVQITPRGADVRYPPAIASVDAGTLVAWTEASGSTAHVHVALVRIDGTIESVHDVTPDAGAAAAPVFDAHAVLHVIDARAGISVVHRTAFGPDGVPARTTVAQPLNLAGEPPSFAVVGAQLGYAAVGNVATRAVGLVTIGSPSRPQPLVAGLGYGAPLTIDATPLGAAALFVMEAPSAADASAPHETRIRVVAASGGMGDATTIAGMIEPRVAASGGVVAIVGRGAAVRWARCAE